MNEKIRYMLFIDPGSEVWKIVILTRVDSLATFILLPLRRRQRVGRLARCRRPVMTGVAQRYAVDEYKLI
jgi:hypothetical protein